MFEIIQDIRVGWGHCDPARIVYYPKFFDWMELGFETLFDLAGASHRALIEADPDFRGTPLVKMSSAFHAPARYGQIIQLRTGVTRWGNASFDVAFRFSRDETLLVEATHTRVFAAATRGETGEEVLRAKAVPVFLREALSEPRLLRLTEAREAMAGIG